MGIPQIPLQVIEKDKRQVMKAYMGIAINYGDRKEVLPLVARIDTLEYDISSAILKVLMKQPKTIGILQGKEARDFWDMEECGFIREEMEKVYNVRKIDLDTERPIPQDISTLLLPAPKELTEKQLYYIDQFIMKGGEVIFLVDTMRLKKGTLQPQDYDTGLLAMLEHYGARVNNDLIKEYDRRAMSMASFSTGRFMSYTVPYGFWLKASRGLFNDEIPAVSQLESLVFPWTSSIEAVEQLPEGVEAVELVKTSPHAVTVTSPYNLTPTMGGDNQDRNKMGEYTTALLLKGKFQSYFKDKELPIKQDDQDKSKTEFLAQANEPSKLVIIGNSRFITLNQAQRHQENIPFFLNIIDYVTMGEDLIGIRSRGFTDKPLEEVSEAKRGTIKFLNNFGVAILVVVFGLGRHYVKRRRKAYAEIMLRGAK